MTSSLRNVTKSTMRYTIDAQSQLQMLSELVLIDSSSHNVSGVQRVQDCLARELQALDFSVRFIPHPTGEFGELLIAERNPSARFKVTLLGHADTVLENRGELSFQVLPEQNFIVGPGVGDDKGGLVVGLFALKAFLQSQTLDIGLRFVSSPNEEVGSLGFWEQLHQIGQESDVVLGLEPAIADGSFVTSRFGNRWYHITVQGRSAHAGRANGEEINAAHELALIIAKLIELRKSRPQIKLNIGAISGGIDKYNVICGEAQAKLDTRFATRSDRDELDDAIVSILSHPQTKSNTGETAKVRYQIVDDCPPLDPGTKPDPATEFLQKTLSQLEGRKVTATRGTGASDTCHMSHPHNLAIDGLGPVTGHMHTAAEFIELKSLNTRTTGLAMLLEHFNQRSRM